MQKKSRRFGEIIYDPYRKIYYRMFHKIDPETLQGSMFVLIFDENFNKILEYEHKAQNNKFQGISFLPSLVGAKGFYIVSARKASEDFLYGFILLQRKD